jgi:PEGA domain
MTWILADSSRAPSRSILRPAREVRARRGWRASVVLGLVLRASAAGAQPEPPPADPATEPFERGRQALLAHRDGEAIVAFQEALAVRPTPGTYRWLGVSLRRAGRTLEAIECIERYLAAPERDAPPDQIEQARRSVEEMRRTLVRLVINVRPAHATLTVDGRARTIDPAGIILDPMPHVFEVSAEGYRAQRVEFRPAEGAQITRDVQLEALGARVVIEVSPAQALVVIDGREAGRGRIDQAVSAGEHVVEVRAPDHESLRRIVTVGVSGVTRVDATLARPRNTSWVLPVTVVGGVILAGGLTAVALWLTRGTEEPLRPPGTWAIGTE